MITVLPTPAPPNMPILPPCTYGSSRSITLIPVSNIWVLGSSSSKGGGSRWIGQRSSAEIESGSTSRASPSTLYTWPRTPSPTGTVIGAPVFTTGAPRTTPSVGFRAMARTIDSPMCWATSHVIVLVSPSSVRSTVRATYSSGSWSGENSTSTTGPITRTIRPFDRSFPPSLRPASPLPSLAIVLITPPPSRSLLGRRLQRLGAADDLADLRGDLALPGLVGHSGQDLDQVLRVLGRGLHRPPPGRVLRRRRLEHRGVDLRGHVSGQEVVEDRRRPGLEDVLGGRLAGLTGHDLLGRDRQEPPVRGPEGERRAEVGVDRVELVDPALGEGRDGLGSDLLRGRVRRGLADPPPHPFGGDPSEPVVRLPLPARHVQHGLHAAFPQPPRDPLGPLQHVRVVRAGQAPVRGDHE